MGYLWLPIATMGLYCTMGLCSGDGAKKTRLPPDCLKNYDDVCSCLRYNTCIWERDRRTDGQAELVKQYHAVHAGAYWCVIKPFSLQICFRANLCRCSSDCISAHRGPKIGGARTHRDKGTWWTHKILWSLTSVTMPIFCYRRLRIISLWWPFSVSREGTAGGLK